MAALLPEFSFIYIQLFSLHAAFCSRLGMMWSGFEPAEGQINETYAATIAQIVDGLASRGIYAYLDMHQVQVHCAVVNKIALNFEYLFIWLTLKDNRYLQYLKINVKVHFLECAWKTMVVLLYYITAGHLFQPITKKKIVKEC